MPVEIVQGKHYTMTVDRAEPFKVRAACGHIVIRRMRETTAGIPYSPDVIIDAPRGRQCDDCEAMGGSHA